MALGFSLSLYLVDWFCKMRYCGRSNRKEKLFCKWYRLKLFRLPWCRSNLLVGLLGLFLATALTEPGLIKPLLRCFSIYKEFAYIAELISFQETSFVITARPWPPRRLQQATIFLMILNVLAWVWIGQKMFIGKCKAFLWRITVVQSSEILQTTPPFAWNERAFQHPVLSVIAHTARVNSVGRVVCTWHIELWVCRWQPRHSGCRSNNQYIWFSTKFLYSGYFSRVSWRNHVSPQAPFGLPKLIYGVGFCCWIYSLVTRVGVSM